MLILMGFLVDWPHIYKRCGWTESDYPRYPSFFWAPAGLVELRLDRIPDTWNNSPQMLATCLSTLPKLTSLSIEFQYPQYLPEPTLQHSPPPARSVLPTLAILFYKGESEYLEDREAQDPQ